MLHADFLLTIRSFFDREGEPTCSFETSVDFQRSTRRFVTENRILRVPSRASNIVSVFIMNVNRAEEYETEEEEEIIIFNNAVP
jgi:hypothetical protein